MLPGILSRAMLCLLVAVPLAADTVRLKRYGEVERKLDRSFESASVKRDEAEWVRVVNAGRDALKADWEREAEAALDRELVARIGTGEDAEAVRVELAELFARAEAELDAAMRADIEYERGRWLASVAPIAPPRFDHETLLDSIARADALPVGTGLTDAYVAWNAEAGETFAELWGNYETALEAERERALAGIEYLDELRAGFVAGLDERLARMRADALADEEIYLIGAKNRFIYRNRYDTDSLRRESEANSASVITRSILDQTRMKIDDLMERALDTGSATYEGDAGVPTVEGYSDRVKAIIDAGLASWRNAEEGLFAARLACEKRAGEDFAKSDRAWEDASEELRARKNEWLTQIQTQLYQGGLVWDNAFDQFDRNYLDAQDELARYLEAQGASWDDYITTLRGMADTGSAALLNGQESIAWMTDLAARYARKGDGSMTGLLSEEIARWREIMENFERILVNSEMMLHAGDIWGGTIGGFVFSGLLDDRRSDRFYLEYTDDGRVVFAGDIENVRDPYLMTAAEFELEKIKIEEKFWNKRLLMAQAVYDFAYDKAGRASKEDQAAALDEARVERDHWQAEFDRARERLTSEFLAAVESAKTNYHDAQEALEEAQAEYDVAEEQFRIANEKLLYLENPNAREILLREINDLTETVSDLRRSVAGADDRLIGEARAYYTAVKLRAEAREAKAYAERLRDAIGVLEGAGDSAGYRDGSDRFAEIVASARANGDSFEALAQAVRDNADDIFISIDKNDPYYMDAANEGIARARAALETAYDRHAAFTALVARFDDDPDAEREAIMFELLPGRAGSGVFGEKTLADVMNAFTTLAAGSDAEKNQALAEIAGYSYGAYALTDFSGTTPDEIKSMMLRAWAMAITGKPLVEIAGLSGPALDALLGDAAALEKGAREIELMGAIGDARVAAETAFLTAKGVVTYLLYDFNGVATITDDTENSAARLAARAKDASRFNRYEAERNHETVTALAAYLKEPGKKGMSANELAAGLLVRARERFADDPGGVGPESARLAGIYRFIVQTARKTLDDIAAMTNAAERNDAWDAFMETISFEERRAGYIRDLYATEIMPDATPQQVMERVTAWQRELATGKDADGNVLSDTDIERRGAYVNALTSGQGALLFSDPRLVAAEGADYAVKAALAGYAALNYDASVERRVKDRSGVLSRIAAAIGKTVEEVKNIFIGGQSYEALAEVGEALRAYRKSDEYQRLPVAVREALAAAESKYIDMLKRDYVLQNRALSEGEAKARLDTIVSQVETLDQVMAAYGEALAEQTKDYGEEERAFYSRNRYALYTKKIHETVRALEARIDDLAQLANFTMRVEGSANIISAIPPLIASLRAKRFEYETQFYMYEYLAHSFAYGNSVAAFRERLLLTEGDAAFARIDEFTDDRAGFADEVAARLRTLDLRLKVREALGAGALPEMADTVGYWLNGFLAAAGVDPASLADDEAADLALFARLTYYDRLNASVGGGGFWADRLASDFRDYGYLLEFMAICAARGDAIDDTPFEDLFAALVGKYAAQADRLDARRGSFEEIYDAAIAGRDVFIERELSGDVVATVLRGEYFADFFASKGLLMTVDDFLVGMGVAESDPLYGSFRDDLGAYRERLSIASGYEYGADIEEFIERRGIIGDSDRDFLRRYAFSPDGASPYAIMELTNRFDLKMASDAATRDFAALITTLYGADMKGGEYRTTADYAEDMGLLRAKATSLYDYTRLGPDAFDNFRSSWDTAFQNWDYYIGKFVADGNDDRFVVLKPGEVPSAEDAEKPVITKISDVEYLIPDEVRDAYLNATVGDPDKNIEVKWRYPIEYQELVGLLLSDKMGERFFHRAGEDGLANSLIDAMTEYNRALYVMYAVSGIEEDALAAASLAGFDNLHGLSPVEDLLAVMGANYCPDTMNPYGADMDDAVRAEKLAAIDTLTAQIENAHTAWIATGDSDIVAKARDEYLEDVTKYESAKKKIERVAKIQKGLEMTASKYVTTDDPENGFDYVRAKRVHQEKQAAYDMAQAERAAREAIYRTAQGNYFSQLNAIAEIYRRLQAAIDVYDTEKAVYEYAATAYLYNTSTNADDKRGPEKLMQDTKQELDMVQGIHNEVLERMARQQEEVNRVKEQDVLTDAEYVARMEELKEKSQRYFRLAKASYLIDKEVQKRTFEYEQARAAYESYRDTLIAANGDENEKKRNEFLDYFMTRDMYVATWRPAVTQIPGLGHIDWLSWVLPAMTHDNEFVDMAYYYNSNKDAIFRTPPYWIGSEPSGSDFYGFMENSWDNVFSGGELTGAMTTFATEMLRHKEEAAQWTRFLIVGGAGAHLLLANWAAKTALESAINAVQNQINRIPRRMRWMADPLKQLLNALRGTLNQVVSSLVNFITMDMGSHYRAANNHLSNAQSAVNNINAELTELRNRKDRMQKAMVKLAEITQIETLDDDANAGVITYRNPRGKWITVRKRSLKTVIKELGGTNGFEISDEDLAYIMEGAQGDANIFDAAPARENPSVVFDENGEVCDTCDKTGVWYYNSAPVTSKFTAHMNQRRLHDMKEYFDYTAKMTSPPAAERFSDILSALGTATSCWEPLPGGEGSPKYDSVVVWRAKENLFYEIATDAQANGYYSALEAGRAYTGYRKAMTDYYGVLEGFSFDDMRELDMLIDEGAPGLAERFAALVGARTGINDAELMQRQALQNYEWQKKREHRDYERARWEEKAADIFERGVRQWANMEASFQEKWRTWRSDTKDRITASRREWDAKTRQLRERELDWMELSGRAMTMNDAEETAARLTAIVNGMVEEMNRKHAGECVIDKIDVSDILSRTLATAPGVIPMDLMKLAGDIDTSFALTQTSQRSVNTAMLDQFEALFDNYTAQQHRAANLRMLVAVDELIDSFTATIADMNRSMHAETFGMLAGAGYAKHGNEFVRHKEGMEQSVWDYKDFFFGPEEFKASYINPYKRKLGIEGDFNRAVLFLDGFSAENLMSVLMKDLQIGFEKKVGAVNGHIGEYPKYDQLDMTQGGAGERERIYNEMIDNDGKAASAKAIRHTVVRVGAAVAATTVGVASLGALAPVSAAIMIAAETYITAEKTIENRMGNKEWTDYGLKIAIAAASAAAGSFASSASGLGNTGAAMVGATASSATSFAMSGVKTADGKNFAYAYSDREIGMGAINMAVSVGSAGFGDSFGKSGWGNQLGNFGYNIGTSMLTAGIAAGEGDGYFGWNGSSDVMWQGFATGMGKAVSNVAVGQTSENIKNTPEGREYAILYDRMASKMISGVTTNLIMTGVHRGSGASWENAIVSSWNRDNYNFDLSDLAGYYGAQAGSNLAFEYSYKKATQELDRQRKENAQREMEGHSASAGAATAAGAGLLNAIAVVVAGRRDGSLLAGQIAAEALSAQVVAEEYPDGTKKVVTTKTDGSVTTTMYDKNGRVVSSDVSLPKTSFEGDRAAMTRVRQADGTYMVYEKNADGTMDSYNETARVVEDMISFKMNNPGKSFFDFLFMQYKGETGGVYDKPVADAKWDELNNFLGTTGNQLMYAYNAIDARGGGFHGDSSVTTSPVVAGMSNRDYEQAGNAGKNKYLNYALRGVLYATPFTSPLIGAYDLYSYVKNGEVKDLISTGEGNGKTESSMRDDFLAEMKNKIGAPYVGGGGNIPVHNGKSTKDANGNYLGFDCCGGIMDSLRKNAPNLPALEQNGMITRGTKEGWLVPVSGKEMMPTDLIFVNWPGHKGNDCGPWDHVMTYGGDNKLITTWKKLTQVKTLIEYSKNYEGVETLFEYRRINFQRLLELYGGRK